MNARATLAMLLERLNWPVREAKWRAALALADLIQSDASDETVSAYLAWTARRELESEIATALAVVLALPEHARPAFERVRESITRPSLLADMMLQFAYGRGQVRGGWRDAHSGPAPASFEPDKRFLDYRMAHIPPILAHEIDRLQSKTGDPFAKQWAFEWHCLMEATKAPGAGPPYYFAPYGIYRTGIMAQVSQRQCDVYRSAYQRVLALGVVEWGLPPARAARLCLYSLPVSGGLIHLEPIDRPAWLGARPGPDASVEVLERFARAVTRSGMITPGRRPIAIKTPMALEAAEFGQVTVTAVLASDDFSLPADWSIGRLPRDLPWFPVSEYNFEGEVPPVEIEEHMVRGASGAAAPLALDIWSMPGGFWHNDLFALGLALPAPYAVPGQASISCARHQINFSCDDAPCASTSFWNDHWTPLHPPQGPTRCGLITELDETQLSTALERTGMKLGWIVEMRYWPDNDRLERRTPVDIHCYFRD
jgi:hypothetical protein